MYPQPLENDKFQDTLSKFGLFFVASSLLYQITLCFLNTHVFSINRGIFILVEFLLIGSGYALFLRKMQPGYLIFVVALITNVLFLALFKGYFDPKNIRDFLIPILMLWLGLNYNNKMDIDKFVAYCAFVVLAIGLFELVLSDTYLSIFNVAKYQLSVGLSTEQAHAYRADALPVNGLRVGGRNLLSFLGDHRISSVFLETVNMGNFGVILACWGLAKDKSKLKEILFFLGLGFSAALLADARFGVSMILGLTIIRLILPINMLRLAGYLSPLFVMAVTVYVYSRGYTEFSDDFKGRLGLTGYNLTHFNFSEYFGVAAENRRFVDSGYGYSLFNSGLVFCIFTWVLFCRLKPKNDTGVAYKSLIAIFISGLLAISGSSVYAMKITSLMWFLMGTLLKKEEETK